MFAATLLAAIALLGSVALGVWTPTISHAVTDLAGVLSPGAKRAISEGLHKHRGAGGVQMAVLIVDSTKGEPIDTFAHRVAVAWGGGSREKSNGVLYVLAIKDRRGRIEVGYGLESKLSDKRAKKILASVRSQLKQRNYGLAVAGVVNRVIARTSGTAGTVDLTRVRQAQRKTSRPPARRTPSPNQRSNNQRASNHDGFDFGAFAIIFVIAMIVVFILAFRTAARNRATGSSGYGGSYNSHDDDDYHHHSYDSGNDWCLGSSSSSSWSSDSSWDDDSSSSWSDDSSFGGSDDWAAEAATSVEAAQATAGNGPWGVARATRRMIPARLARCPKR